MKVSMDVVGMNPDGTLDCVDDTGVRWRLAPAPGGRATNQAPTMAPTMAESGRPGPLAESPPGRAPESQRAAGGLLVALPGHVPSATPDDDDVEDTDVPTERPHADGPLEKIAYWFGIKRNAEEELRFYHTRLTRNKRLILNRIMSLELPRWFLHDPAQPDAKEVISRESGTIWGMQSDLVQEIQPQGTPKAQIPDVLKGAKPRRRNDSQDLKAAIAAIAIEKR